MRVMRRLVGYFRRTVMSARGQIAEGNDTNEALLVIEYRQPTDLLIGHGLGKITDLIVLEAVLDLGAHHVADTGFRTEALGDPSHGDIAVRDHSHQTLVVADRQHADVAFLHLDGDVTQFLTWAGETDIPCHHFTDFHPFLLSSRRDLLGNGSPARTVPIASSQPHGRTKLPQGAGISRASFIPDQFLDPARARSGNDYSLTR